MIINAPSREAPRVVVNADDFGMSARVNAAIAASFEEGLVSSATIMSNMPGFEEACAVTRHAHLTRRIGIHINITEGPPLTDRIRAEPRFCDADGQFAFRRGTVLYLTPSEQTAVAEEVTAQIERCRAGGLSLTHADSHHHVHTEIPVFVVVAGVLRRHQIGHVRLSRNTRPSSWSRRLYKAGFNRCLAWQGWRRTDYFGDLEDFRQMREHGRLTDKSFELMVHPTYSEADVLIDAIDLYPLTMLADVLRGCPIEPYPLSETSVAA